MVVTFRVLRERATNAAGDEDEQEGEAEGYAPEVDREMADDRGADEDAGGNACEPRRSEAPPRATPIQT